ncbi:MAG: hypothetical protein IKW02_01465 [Clostridia bacterium]|nr:hypothetical protein [Clostridia bacterium]
MKKFILVFVLLMLVALGVYAAPGDPIGDIIETDILTYINNKPINSYNIRGQTVVIVEELCNNDTGVHYGFTSAYDDETRTLTLDSNFTTGNANAVVSRGVNGGVVGTVIETDIRVFFNGIEITGYNIRGKTAICVEEMGAYTADEHNAPYGYSKYLCNAVWHEDSRELFLNTFLHENNFFDNYPAKKLKFELNDNMLSCSFDQLNPFDSTLSIFMSDDFKNNNYKINPIYFGGEAVGQIISAPGGMAFFAMNEAKTYAKTSLLEKVLPYGAAIEYVEKNFNVKTVLDDDNAHIYLAEKDGVHYLLFVLKQGGLICDSKYDSSYSVVSLDKKDGVPTLTLKTNNFSGSMPVSTAGYTFREDYGKYASGSISNTDRLSTRMVDMTISFDGSLYPISAMIANEYSKSLMVELTEICDALNIKYYMSGGIFYLTTDLEPHELAYEVDSDAAKIPSSVNIIPVSTVYVDGAAKNFTYYDGADEKIATPYYVKGKVYVPIKLFEDLFN